MRLVDRFIPLMAQTELFFGDGAVGEGAALRETVDRLIEAVRRDASADGLDADDVEAALFPVVVWFDEVAMNTEWPGQREWKGAQLQRSLFQTSRGGELFFERLATLPPEKNGVREVYLLCLSLGFKGKYYLTPGRVVPDELMRHHLDLLLKSKEEGDIPSPYRLYIASARIDAARKGGILLPDVPLFNGAYGDGQSHGPGPERANVMTRAMWGAASAPLILLCALYLVFNYELGHLVDIFIGSLGR